MQLHVGKLRLVKFKQLAQYHTSTQGQDLNSGLSDDRTGALKHSIVIVTLQLVRKT